jgi:hypothetical protein
MDDLKDAIVVLGFAHTQLFNGTEGIELILLDLATGADFTMPITEEQASIIFQYKQARTQHGETEGLRPRASASEKDVDPLRDAGEIDQF